MPKQTYKIQGFHGGISSDTDPRDIQDIESPSLVDASIDSVGRIKTLGSVSVDIGETNTLQILPNKGLFVMGSDKQLDKTSVNETFIIAHDDNGNSFDIKQVVANAWSTAQIYLNTTNPVFYVGDGNLRIGDGGFSDASNSQWFGYIVEPRFDGLLADSGPVSGDVGWVAENQLIASPTVGNCLISTPFAGGDSNGVNSSSSEYIGSGADADYISVNLRVGLQYTELLDNASSGWAGTNANLSDDTTYYPIIANKNVKATTSASAAYSEVVELAQSFSIDDENSVVFGFYITSAEYATFEKIRITCNTEDDGGGDYIRYVFALEEIKPDCWNLLVLSSSNIIQSTYTLGDDLSRWAFRCFNTATASPTFWLSGPVAAKNVSLTGYQPGLYSFYHTYLYDDEKQESLPFLFTDSGSGDVNKLNIVGDSVLLNFDSYINPFNSAGTPAYTISKRITGSRLYYKLQENDNFQKEIQCLILWQMLLEMVILLGNLGIKHL